ncbi:MAG: hypothetical protein U0T69_11235 [Chitinophagales bacterium]
MQQIKNYTSTVPAATSISRIEQYLVEAGATDISKKYNEDKFCTGIVFRLMVNNMPLFFKLTAKTDACYKVLYAQYKRPTPDTRKNCAKQAEQTAWKIISDWVEIQLTMIRLEQVELMQIFLPFVYDASSDKTFFDKLKDSEYKQLLLK